jgi:tetratricopeptide (TPR) repeat protein
LHLKRAISMDSTYETPRVMLALVALQWSDPRAADSATTAAERLARRATPAELALLRYVRACLSGKVDDAVAASQSFMALQPGSMEAPLLAANVALSARRPQLAMQALERTDPDHGLNLAGSYYWEFKSEAARQLGHLSESADIAREGLHRFPDEFESVFTLAMPLTAAGRVDELRTLLKKTRPLWASWTAAELVVPGLVMAGRRSEAKSFAQEWLRRTEGDSVGRLSEAEDRALLLLENERWADLDVFTRRWTLPSVVDYDHLTMIALRAIALIHLGRSAEAAAIDSALDKPATTPMRGRYLYARAQIAAHRGEPDRAIGLIESALAAGYGLEFYSTGVWHDPLVMGLAGLPRLVALVKAGA